MSSTKANLHFETICLHGGHNEENNRAHITPVYASSTYTFESAEQAANYFQGKAEAYVYGRFGSPSISEVEQKIALLEAYNIQNADGSPLQLKAILFASGMAAVSSLILANLKSGDKLITHGSLYGGTQEYLDKILPDLGISTICCDFHNPETVEQHLAADSSIKMMYLETPANPTLQCVDLELYSGLARKYNVLVAVDNTFSTPYLQQPFRYAVDYVLHSTTKFLNGHGTAIGGVLVGRDIQEMSTKVTKTHRLLGANSNSFDAFLLNNGLKTLPIRMEAHCANAQNIATYLAQHPAVEKVNYPGLAAHPDHALTQKQMKYAGGVLSFEVKGGIEAGKKFLNKVKMCVHAVSLGTCDTLISHPASTTHAGVNPEMRLQSGISDGLIRMSVGIENVVDIIRDLEQALA